MSTITSPHHCHHVLIKSKQCRWHEFCSGQKRRRAGGGQVTVRTTISHHHVPSPNRRLDRGWNHECSILVWGLLEARWGETLTMTFHKSRLTWSCMPILHLRTIVAEYFAIQSLSPHATNHRDGSKSFSNINILLNTVLTRFAMSTSSHFEKWLEICRPSFDTGERRDWN